MIHVTPTVGRAVRCSDLRPGKVDGDDLGNVLVSSGIGWRACHWFNVHDIDFWMPMPASVSGCDNRLIPGAGTQPADDFDPEATVPGSALDGRLHV